MNYVPHYVPLLMQGNSSEDSVKSPFYYAFDGRSLAVCFCTQQKFCESQMAISRSQHLTDDYIASGGEWGLGMIEFGSIKQIMLFVQKWDVTVQTKVGTIPPTALALWVEGEPHRFIYFKDIVQA